MLIHSVPGVLLEWVRFGPLTKYDATALPSLKRIAQKFPRNRIVMEHFGALVGPGMGEAAFEQWKKDVPDAWPSGLPWSLRVLGMDN